MVCSEGGACVSAGTHWPCAAITMFLKLSQSSRSKFRPIGGYRNLVLKTTSVQMPCRSLRRPTVVLGPDAQKGFKKNPKLYTKNLHKLLVSRTGSSNGIFSAEGKCVIISWYLKNTSYHTFWLVGQLPPSSCLAEKGGSRRPWAGVAVSELHGCLWACNKGVPLFKENFCFKISWMWKFLFWFSGLRSWHSVHGDAGSIPGLSQWAKDLGLPQAVL